MVREILVVKRDVLFEDKKFQGFCPISETDFSDVILSNFEFQERDKMETNPAFQQIVSYVWLINPKTRQVFLYRRSAGGDEGRLHNKYSGGVGGHIDKDTEENSENPITDAMIRELKEEVSMENYPMPKFFGFVKDDSDSVGQVHFGVVGIAETEEDVKPAMHMSSGEFFSIEDAEEIFGNPENNVESWTQISWPFVKEYLEGIQK